MEEDQTAHFECLKKAHLELQERHAKSCDDISQMMEILKMLTKAKQDTESPNPPKGTTPRRNTSEETSTVYASPSVVFPLNYDLLRL